MPGIEPHRVARTRGRRQQQVLQVAREHLDRLLVGALAQLAHQVERQREHQLHPPRPVHDAHQPDVAGKLPADLVCAGDHPLHRLHRRGILGIDLDVELQELFVASAQHGERTMARHGGPALAMIEVVGELRAGLFLALGDLGAQERVVLEVAAQPPDQLGVLRERLGQDIARAVERGLHVRHLGGDVRLRERRGNRCAIGHDRIRERTQPALARDLGLGAALGLVRQVDVFEFRLGGGGCELAGKLVGQLALAADRFDDRVAPGVELAHIDQALGEQTQLVVVEPAGDLLAIARDERHGRAFVEQLDGRSGLLRLGADLGRDDGGDA